VVIIDEAQDLSRLQWNLVEALAQKAKRVFIAGDDDQAVFTWAGADVNSFLSLKGKITVLSQSYRVPARVYRLANTIVQRIQQRQEKEWRPREFEGEVFSYNRIEDVPVSSGQWLIMASTNYLLTPIAEWLKSLGLLYERAGVPSISANIIHAVYDWERLRKGQKISGADVKNVYKYLGSQAVARGHKSFKAGENDVMYSIEDLQANFGLLTTQIWHEALDKISDNKREYIIAMLRRGTKLSSVPNIRISTIHGAKGGEADNVALLMDLSTRFAKEYAENSDNIHRLFYVGVTRAKKTLHLILPRQMNKGFRL
jgi:DNA helicase-2/ATP-dependent DNA helicase PcrA